MTLSFALLAAVTSRSQQRPCFIAIPARNERERIGPCLAAIAASLDRPPPTIVLLANNTTDATGAIACETAARLGLALHLFEVELPPDRSSAGEARRLAMDRAARLAPDGAVLITTDADGRVEPAWLDANLRAIDEGADAACGVAIICPDEARAIPQVLHDDDAREMLYAALLDELNWLIDPEPADPWPRHSEESGASIAVRADIFHRSGGIPSLPSGEDRAFLASLRRIDARIRHTPDARVIVSGRLDGRAAGGMAETIKRRLAAQDEMLDDRLEPAGDAVRRFGRRASLRDLWRSGYGEGMCFGALWERHEAADAILGTRRRVARAEIEPAITRVRDLVHTLKAAQRGGEASSRGLEPVRRDAPVAERASRS